VAQKGSFVDANRLRFDFSHSGPMQREELGVVEHRVNGWIRENLLVEICEKDKDAAIAAGATALFGEKYQDIVRVVHIGAHSVELCGGTHVLSTGNIGFFHILGETGIGSGVRRIEAVAGVAACQYVNALYRNVEDSLKLLNTSEENLCSSIKTILSDNEKLRRDILLLQTEKAFSVGLLEERVGLTTILCQKVASVKAREARNRVDTLKKEVSARIVVVLSEESCQTRVYVGVSKDLENAHSAVVYLNAITAHLQDAGGGGRPDFAQGGGRGVLDAKDVLSIVRSAYEGA
jgi:alanyl-tRNA synthetase